MMMMEELQVLAAWFHMASTKQSMEATSLRRDPAFNQMKSAPWWFLHSFILL